MDSSLLQLFGMEEILERLSAKQSTGCLHVFTAKESANLAFKDGLIVGATKGLVEGEEVVKQILEWKDARCVWQADTPPPSSPKPVQIEVADFLYKVKVAPKIAIGGRTLSEATTTGPAKHSLTEADLSPPSPPRPPASFTSLSATSRTSLSATSSKALPAIATEPESKTTGLLPAAVPMTATKNLHSNQQARLAHEDALLRKHPLVLVSFGDPPEQRLKLGQISTLIGRNPACDFTLDNGSVSRQHCLLQITDRGLHVKDLGTTNGTKVNGIVLTEGYINVGDRLTIGNLMFVLEKDVPVEMGEE